jgi:hypothetical protein
MNWLLSLCSLATLLWGLPVLAQTTQGLISGQVVDLQDGSPIADAQVTYASLAASSTGTARTNASGYYALPLLPPGVYQVRVTADRYQAQELHELELAVAAFLEINFRLRPLTDVWEQGQYRSFFPPNTNVVLTFFGPDVDSSHFRTFEGTRRAAGGLESTVSQVIDPVQVMQLPLAGRDVYTMLATQPGVTSDTSTARGLGLAINGQRPSASNFLLDGLENNNYLLTGPLNPVAPEAVQEYRISTNNFSAEYGRTAGFLANAVTRAGGSEWHGLGYFYTKNEALNANDFQRNRIGLPRTPVKEAQPGFSVGGPLRPERLFASASLEFLRSRSQSEPQTFQLPTPAFFAFIDPSAGSIAKRLLRDFPPPPVADGNLFTAAATMAPPVSVDRYLALPRIDYLVSENHRIMGRATVARLERPDFIWTPYQDFVSPLNQNSFGLALSPISNLRPDLTNEFRFGWNSDDLQWSRAHSEIPTLASQDGTLLPGSPAFYGYRNRNRSAELVENLLWVQGRHIVKAGGGFLLRRLDGFLTAGRDPLFLFDSLLDFAFDSPSFMAVSVRRRDLPNLAVPEYDRAYRHNQFYAYAQDSFKVSPRLVLNFGLRYERFGAPRNVGAVKEGELQLGPGNTVVERLAAARLLFPQGGAAQRLYDSDTNDWAARFGFSYNLESGGRTLLRGAYGTFYDRPFDNLWQNLRSNSIVLGGFRIAAPRTDYLASPASLLPGFRNTNLAQDFPNITLYQPGLRSAYVHSYFFGVQRQLAESMTLEVNTLGSLGRKLITTDLINRAYSVPLDPDNFLQNPFGRYNPAVPSVAYRSNQGLSSYNALTVLARRRTGRTQFQAAYTWSRTIDNQSEPLAGDFFNLTFAGATGGGDARGLATFTRQFDSRVDRGNSDFDQRHNLVVLSIWEIPALFPASRAAPVLRGWQFSQLAAVRSGFPYTVNAPSPVSLEGGDPLLNNRADLADPAGASAFATVDGGRRLLNAGAFRIPAGGRLGSSGRNNFTGPGLFNIDLSLSRSFAVRTLGEAGRVTLRADVFNVLNHANLNNPEPFLSSDNRTFGVALYGRKGRSTGFPAVAPFNETARQVQLLLRVQF